MKVMVKVTIKVGGEVAGQKVSVKKKKDEKKVLKVISKRNGAADPKLSLKSKKKKKKKKKNRRKNKINTNEGETGAPSEIKSAESSPAVGDSNSGPQESNTDNKDKQKGNKVKNAPTSDTSSSTVKEELTSVTTVEEESASTTTGTQEAATELTKAGENQESTTQGKKKRKRKNKRKAAEAFEVTEGTSETTENKDDDSPDKAEGEKEAKRMKVKKNEGENKGDKSKSKKSKNQEKKHVLFVGNLPFEVTRDEILEHFKVVSDSIVRVALMSRQKNGKGKGYGFLEFADATSYNNALKLNMSEFKGRKINVEFTTPGKNTKKRKVFIKNKTKKLLGQKKGHKEKKKGSRKH